MQQRIGNVPDLTEGWRAIHHTTDPHDKSQWTVFSRPQQQSADWETVKIIATERVTGKANFWLVKNIRTGQIGYARDYAMLRQQRPELHARIEFMFNNRSVVQ